jgi:N-acetyldiaminopimelate deacetylase
LTDRVMDTNPTDSKRIYAEGISTMFDLIQIRKDLHKIPELGFEEFKTQNYLLEILETFKGIKIHTFSFPGILVDYSNGKGQYKLFRADMDGLPINENTNCGYESEHKGKMHACGHDMHMTILLGLIQKMVSQKAEQNLLFLFQPAEEGKGGAERILKTGIFDTYDVSEAYALHVSGGYKTGEIASRSGTFFANVQGLDVVFKGTSAHVAYSEKGRDALAAGVEFYLELGKEIRKRFPIGKPVICIFGKMNAGPALNAIPSECNLGGSFRAYTEENHTILKKLIETLTSEIALKYGVRAEIHYGAYYKEVVNDKDLFEKLKYKASEMGIECKETERVLVAEDFGFFTDKYRGLLFWLGVGNENSKVDIDLHSPQFLPDEKAIAIGIGMFARLI